MAGSCRQRLQSSLMSAFGHRPQSLSQLDSSLRGSAHYKDCVFATDRADDFRPTLSVDRFGDGLRPSRKGVQNQELADAVRGIEKLR